MYLCGDETNAADHSFQKVTPTQQIFDKAVPLREEYIMVIEAKHHRNCYTVLNHYYNTIYIQDIVSENLETTSENESI